MKNELHEMIDNSGKMSLSDNMMRSIDRLFLLFKMLYRIDFIPNIYNNNSINIL